MGENDLILRLADIGFAYPGGPKVLNGLNFELRRGERVGLLGPNGSGKSTLFHLIMGLLKPTEGSLEIFGRPARTEADFVAVRRRIGLLFQDADDQLFSPTVLEDVAFGPLNLGKRREEAVEIARRTLAFLGLSGFENRITYKLAGGEKRLVSLATVLAMEPEVLLFDEPTNGLDERTRSTLIHVLRELDLSFILLSHEIDFLNEVTDTIYLMDKGRICIDEALRVHQHLHVHPLGTHPHEHR